MKRTAVFVSGRGSNLQALLDQEGCNIRLVCSHKDKLPADLKAKRHFISVFKTKKIDFNHWNETLKVFKIQNIFLLGFMRLIPPEFVQTWSKSILNVHPSLLPLFPGLEAVEKSFASNAAMGVTIHRVISEMDAGTSIAQSRILKPQNIPNDLNLVSLMITFREHFLVRRVGEKWN